MRHTTLALLLLPATALAQTTMFWRGGNLTAMSPPALDLAAAVSRLCAGPTAAERQNGFSSALPAGTRLVALRQKASEVTLVFDAGLLGAVRLEDAIEQLTATARSAGMDAVHLHIGNDDGTDTDLSALLPPAQAFPHAPPLPLPIDNLVPGALSGRTVAVSPGHGYYWHSTLGWTTQRGVIDGLVEDRHTNEIAIQYLMPFLENLGARVLSCRERGETEQERIVDNDAGAPAYTETGGWSTSASAGYLNSTYRFAGTGPSITATATWTLPVPQDGSHPVYACFRAGSNRAPDARFTIRHAGGETTVQVDQTTSNLSWEYLGEYWFTAAQGARVVLDNLSSLSGRVVIADAVRLGGGQGSIARGGGTSNRPRWQECARYQAQFNGAPSSVYDSIAGGQDNDDDVTARPRYAEWRGADLFLSLHTNAGGGAGTDTYIHDTSPTPGSQLLQSLVQSQVVNDIRAYYAPSWTNRGTPTANFGELRLLSSMPGVLCELAFHDTPGSLDMQALHDPRFRYIAGRALSRAVLRYFAPAAPFPPEPPTALRVTQDGARGLRVAFDAVAGATHYTVEQSPDGKGFVQVADVTAPSWSTGPLPHHSMLSFRVRAWNTTGRSFPTEVLTAGTDHTGSAQLLLVQGFDRLDRSVMFHDNTFDYLRLHGDAIRRDAAFSLGFDAASNEAVQLGRVVLGNYDAVDWALGEESTADQTFSASEQTLVQNYLNGGGRLLVSGAEIGWDLDAQGSAGDRAFYRNVLGASYVADDAGTYQLQAGVPGSISQGLPGGFFDDGTHGTYDVDWPDVLAPYDARSTVCLRYGNGMVAGIQKLDPATGARVVNLGLPLETIVDATLRAGLMQGALHFLLASLPLDAPAIVRVGQRANLTVTMPGEANRTCYLFTGLATAPGIPLPGNVLLPLQDGFLLTAGLTSPFFGNFVSQLSASGTTSAWVDVPPLPLLAGVQLYFAAVTLQAQVPAAAAVSNWVRVRIAL